MLKHNFYSNYELKFTLALFISKNNTDSCTSSGKLITLQNVIFPAVEQSHKNTVLEDNEINITRVTDTSPQPAGLY